MNVAWLGLGRLGLPCALAIADHPDHTVVGYDPAITGRPSPAWQEPGVADLLDRTALTMAPDVETAIRNADVVFVAVQTPHAPDYDGSRPAPDQRRDFSYTHLVEACRQVASAARRLERHVTLVVVSTVLPGTMDRHIRPLLGEHVTLAYNPYFIAMGSTLADFLAPEFVLVGTDHDSDADPLRKLYGSLHDRPVYRCSIPSAELTKVAYNTFISAKIAVANSLMEICHHTAADVDEVTDALALATDRVISPRYLRGGMGDGGACHPRDLIAMSWLAERLDLSYDLFGSLVRGREAQTRWLADLAVEQAEVYGLGTVVVLGKAYKAGTNLTQGSPALLLAGYLAGRGVEVTHYDPLVDGGRPLLGLPAVYVVATNHDEFADWPFEAGSVVIDPWRYVAPRPGVTVVPVGGRNG